MIVDTKIPKGIENKKPGHKNPMHNRTSSKTNIGKLLNKILCRHLWINNNDQKNGKIYNIIN